MMVKFRKIPTWDLGPSTKKVKKLRSSLSYPFMTTPQMGALASQSLSTLKRKKTMTKSMRLTSEFPVLSVSKQTLDSLGIKSVPRLSQSHRKNSLGLNNNQCPRVVGKQRGQETDGSLEKLAFPLLKIL